MMMRADLNVCQFGHPTHETHLAGGMTVYDWSAYQGLAGYCSGQDDVSRTIDLYGFWEAEETAKVLSVVRPGDLVLDFGAHIGWYSRQCYLAGADVFAFEADPENVRLLRLNCPQVRVWEGWVKDHDRLSPSTQVRVVKADVEGAENDVLEVVSLLLDWRMVDFLLVECSPELDGYYPELVDGLIGRGYTATAVGKEGERPVTGATLGPVQANVWFERV